MALGQEGWRPLTGQIGGLADVPNGKGEAKQMSNSVKREEALSCFLAGSTGGKSSLHEMDSQLRAELYPEPGLDLNIGFHICMYFFFFYHIFLWLLYIQVKRKSEGTGLGW